MTASRLRPGQTWTALQQSENVFLIHGSLHVSPAPGFLAGVNGFIALVTCSLVRDFEISLNSLLEMKPSLFLSRALKANCVLLVISRSDTTPSWFLNRKKYAIDMSYFQVRYPGWHNVRIWGLDPSIAKDLIIANTPKILCRPRDVIYFLQALTNSFQTSISKV